jgi:hypothetical protein
MKGITYTMQVFCSCWVTIGTPSEPLLPPKTGNATGKVTLSLRKMKYMLQFLKFISAIVFFLLNLNKYYTRCSISYHGNKM